MRSTNRCLIFIRKCRRLFAFHASILHLALIFPVLSTNSQDIHNGGTIYISEKAEIHLPSGLTSNGFVENNGKISIAGNWSNSKIYQGSGSVELVGSDQSFHNNSQPVQDLSIQGGGIKSFRGKTTIGGTIHLREGILTVNDGDTLLIAGDAAVMGGSASSYVEGALFTSGTGYKYFPLGKNGIFLPVELLDVKGVDPVISIGVSDITEFPVISNVTKIFPYYWVRTDVKGYFDKSAVAVGLSEEMGVEDLAILQSINQTDFSVVDQVQVTAKNEHFRSLTTDVELKGKILTIGQTSGSNGENQQFYLSTTLSPGALKPENRTCKLFGNGLSSGDFLFEVHDRWGNIVFETRSQQLLSTHGWDGKSGLTGQFLPTGAYPFILKGTDISGTRVTSRGVITVIYQ